MSKKKMKSEISDTEERSSVAENKGFLNNLEGVNQCLLNELRADNLSIG